MRFGTVKHSLLLGFGVAVVTVGTWMSPPAGAVNTEVTTQVCGNMIGPVGSSITIIEPVTDTIVKEAELEIVGTVARATQITILVDNTYVHTVPLGAQQTSYTTALSLTEGTHTIELVANDVCNEQNDSKTIVVTYTRPAAPPDQPDGDDDKGGGVVVGDDVTRPTVDERSVFETISQMPIVGPIVGFGSWMIYILGLDHGLNSAATGLLNIWRVLLLATGLLVLAFTHLSLRRMGGRFIIIIEKTVIGKELTYRYRLWVLRIIAMLCVVGALLL